MKLKIKIQGTQVQGVGYRYFLMNLAMTLRIRKFDAQNIDGGKEQEVEVLIDSDETKVIAFEELVQAKHPARAVVSKILFEDYTENVMSINDYMLFCTNVQLNKALPVLLDIREDMGDMKDYISGMRSDLSGVKDDISGMRKDIVTGQNGIIDELRDLREDLARRDAGERLTQMEKDIRSIKSKLSLR